MGGRARGSWFSRSMKGTRPDEEPEPSEREDTYMHA